MYSSSCSTYRLLNADLHWLPLSFNSKRILLDTRRSLTFSANPFFALISSYSRKVLNSESLGTPSLSNSFLSIIYYPRDSRLAMARNPSHFTLSLSLRLQFIPGHSGSCGPLYLNRSSGVDKNESTTFLPLPFFRVLSP